MPFKDLKEGQTHYNGDDCYKCKTCNAHIDLTEVFNHYCDLTKSIKTCGHANNIKCAVCNK
jgi:hypothetical protein